MPEQKNNQAQKPVIAISYRDEGNGKGAFYDHLTLRSLTGWMTEIAHDESINTSSFANFINYHAGFNLYDLPIDGSLPASSVNQCDNSAFLFIPGYTRDSDSQQNTTHLKRIRYEQNLINKARSRGQPILAVCAGSWTLWEALGGKVKAISDHNYGGAMPRLSKSKAKISANKKICNNKMIHRIKVSPHTFLNGAMKIACSDNALPQVNSVHWKACDNNEKVIPEDLVVSALSVSDNGLAPKNRQGKQMQPEECVEGFETKHGAPVIGVQWHPEAFNPNENIHHNSLFQFMKDAGNTYLNRKALNQEFQKIHGEKSSDRITFFSKEKHEQVKPKQEVIGHLSDSTLEIS